MIPSCSGRCAVVAATSDLLADDLGEGVDGPVLT
jgi:hypothetical protein